MPCESRNERSDLHEVARLLDRAAVAREVERVHLALARQRLGVEEPVVEVAAEAVQEHERLAALALAQEADAVRDLRRWTGVLLGLARHERGLELGHEGVDLGVGDRRVGDHAEQSADRDDLAVGRHPAAEHARRR